MASVTREIRIVTLLVECEQTVTNIGNPIAERAYKVQNVNNCVVLSENAVSDPLVLREVCEALSRMKKRADELQVQIWNHHDEPRTAEG